MISQNNGIRELFKNSLVMTMLISVMINSPSAPSREVYLNTLIKKTKLRPFCTLTDSATQEQRTFSLPHGINPTPNDQFASNHNALRRQRPIMK